MSIYGYNIINEYSGNDTDNKNFARCMEELGKIGKYYVEIDQSIADHIDFIIDKMKKCKKTEDVKKLLNDSYNHGDETCKKLNDIYKNFAERPTFSRFRSLVKKFSVKYSDVTMEEKKKWTEVFVGYHKDMINIVQAYDEKWFKDVNDELTRLKKLDYETTVKLTAHIQGFYNGLYDYFRYTHNNIIYVIRQLDTGFEDSFKYKMIQKIFKSK